MFLNITSNINLICQEYSNRKYLATFANVKSGHNSVERFDIKMSDMNHLGAWGISIILTIIFGLFTFLTLHFVIGVDDDSKNIISNSNI